MNRYLTYTVKKNDDLVSRFLTSQVLDKKRRDYGGLRERYVDVKTTVHMVSVMSACYSCEMSTHYESEGVHKALLLALDYILRAIRETGTLDFLLCNFSSAPDTAFALEKLIPSYLILKDEMTCRACVDKLHIIIEQMTLGVLKGGFHTPNHRWVISSALLMSRRVISNPEILLDIESKVKQYLNEGIDCTEDGEYAERSSGNYNAIVNQALINLYEETGHEVYLDYVYRNLNMMVHYFDPDGTIFTENSTRQDKGIVEYGFKYFYQYLYTADKFKDDSFGALAHKLMQGCMSRDECPDILLDLLMNKALMDYKMPKAGPKNKFNKEFVHSGLVRFRKKNFAYTLMKNSKDFLTVKYNDMKIIVRVGVSICHTRYFEIQDIISRESGYELNFETKDWYYLPFDHKQETSDWWQMDHGKRTILTNNELKFKIHINHLEAGLSLRLEVLGSKLIPIRLEVALASESMLEGKQFTLPASKGGYLILKEDTVRVQESYACTIGPGFAEHSYLGHTTGDARDSENFSLIMTDYSPMDKTITIQFEDQEFYY